MTGRSRLSRVFGLLLAAWVGLGASDPATAPSAFRPLVNEILGFFPPLVGDVLEAQGGELLLSIGRREGAQVGMEFSVFREGRELKHPKSGVVLGRIEETLGVARISRVFETHSMATVLSGNGIQPGDRARIFAGKVSLMVMAVGSAEVRPPVVEAAVNQLWEELTATGRFQLISGDGLTATLADEGIPPEQIIQEEGLVGTAGRSGASHLLAVQFKQVQAKPLMEARLFSLSPGRETTPLVMTALFLPPATTPAPEDQPSANPRPREPPRPPPRSFLARLLFGDKQSGTYSARVIPLRGVVRFGFPVLAMDVAVSPKDQSARLVVTDGDRISLYRIANRTLEPEWTYAAGSLGRVVSVQLADLDGDGILEVVANRYHSQPDMGLNSFILTTRDGKAAVVVQDVSQILLAVDARGDGIKKTLWLQRFTPDGFFMKGQVESGHTRNGTLVVEGAVRVPSDFRAMGATMSNIAGKGQRALAYIDDQNRLAIAVEGQEVWRSALHVGGGGYLQLEVFKRLDPAGRRYFYSMEPMPLAVDLDGDGVEEIVVPQNQFQGALGVVSRVPGGYQLQPVSSGFEGVITGVGAIPGEGTPTLVAAVVRFSAFLGTSFFKASGETQIIMSASE